MKRISGVDLSVVDGFGGVAGANGHYGGGDGHVEVSSEKHFCSWLGLGAEARNLGAKVKKNKTLKTKNRAGKPFGWRRNRSNKRTVCLGRCIRRKSRLDKAQRPTATAHAIARVVYRMLKYKVEYRAINVKSTRRSTKNSRSST
ncbi:MAG: hypothetical protein HS124_06815 [Anaerolineales bacterium]|nr:hypothetical protein [Anaerolineales bacterium]